MATRTCGTMETDDPGVCCKKADGDYTVTTWRVFYPRCPKVNVNRTCNPLGGAYVAAITVCTQQLYT